VIERQSEPKVKFREPKLVEYEPEGDKEVMELQSCPSNQSSTKDEESSNESFIDEEFIEASHVVTEDNVELESFQQSTSVDSDNNLDTDYGKDDFYDEKDDQEDLKLPKDSRSSVKKKVKVEAWCEPEEDPRSNTNVTIINSANLQKIKTCCEYKKRDGYKEKLPKYNGFVSKYGLSKEEIDRRNFVNSKMYQKRQLQVELQKERSIARKQINEEAFSKW
jgi:hypothetical protein